MNTIDLNCDMGESFGRWTLGNDEAIMPHITSANIACGAHAGDPAVMLRTVRLAKQYDVAIGAHPGYADLQGFGRRSLAMSPDEVKALVLYQLGALWGVARAEGAELNHVKPHGALYNSACVDASLAQAIVAAVADFSRGLAIFGLPASKIEDAAHEADLKFVAEGFADRAYEPNGQLRDRKHKGSLYEDADFAARQALALASGHIEACDGTPLALNIRTICIHGDGPAALEIARAVHTALEEANIAVRRP